MAKLKCRLHVRRVHVYSDLFGGETVLHRSDGSHCASQTFFLGQTTDKAGKVHYGAPMSADDVLARKQEARFESTEQSGDPAR